MVSSRRIGEKEDNFYLKDIIIIWREVREVSLRLRHLCWESEKAGSPGSRLFWVHHIECDGESGCRPWRQRASSTPSDWAGKSSPMWDNRANGKILSLKTHKRKPARSSRNGGRVESQLVECFPSGHEALGLIPATHKPGMMHTCRKWKKGYSSRLHNSFKVTLGLGHMRPWEIEREGKKGKREVRKRTKKEDWYKGES